MVPHLGHIAVGHLVRAVQVGLPVAGHVTGDDGSATFGVYAPNAGRVSVTGQIPGSPVEMSRDANGWWSVKIDSLKLELYRMRKKLDSWISALPFSTRAM